MSFKTIEFTDVKGVNNIKLSFNPNSQMHVFIGNNGSGKTKSLESLYIALLLSSNSYVLPWGVENNLFKSCFIDGNQIINDHHINENNTLKLHNRPVVYIPASSRGNIDENISSYIPMKENEIRKGEFFEKIRQYIYSGLKSSQSNAYIPIDQWFIQRAQSANVYQADEDNREVEILSVLNILNQIDERISNRKDSISIHGGTSVSITVDNKKMRLSELSSGFASLLKIVQEIVAGYSFFTNATDIENVNGIVLIDEIESHLHISWQTKILPLLSKVFPNTTFIISTHSSLVLSQLYKGMAYQLNRDEDGVTNKEIPNPSNNALVDLLYNAFDVNLNQINLNSITEERQKDQQSKLTSLLNSFNG